MNFWVWLRRYANEKIKATHVHSRKCERCLLWTSEVGGAKAVWISPECEWVEEMKCNHCGHVSSWDMTGMIPVLIPSEAYKALKGEETE